MTTKNSKQQPSLFALTAQMEFTAGADTGDGKPVLPRFSMIAYTGGPMRIAGWRYPVIVDLSGLSIPLQARPIRLQHDENKGVGHTDSIRVEGGKLLASGVISRDTADAKEVVTSSRNGFPWQASIGASVDVSEFVKENKSVLVNGQTHHGPVNVVRRATLGEISFVDLGADGNTSAIAATKAGENTSMSKDATETTDTTTNAEGTEAPKAEAKATGGTDAAAPPITAAATTNAPADPVAEIRASAAAEVKRIADVRAKCGDKHADIAAKAIAEGWDANKTELEVLRASRPEAPAVHSPDNATSTAILEAACLMSGGIAGNSLLDSHGKQAVEAASKKYKGSLGLQELLLEAAWANGYTGRTFRDSRAVLRYAFAGSSIQAQGYSTISIGGILSNVANKFLLEGFFSVERSWREICAIRNVTDFKTVTSYRLIGDDMYEELTPAGELKHGTLGEEEFTNKAETYGKILAITRKDIINDDLGAITTVPRKLGRGSGLKINDVFWTVFMNNGTFFTAGNRNLSEGVDSALSIDGLTKAETMFMDQVDSDGKPIGLVPQIMLVPTSLSAMATNLHQSQELRDNTTGRASYPTNNPHRNKFRPVVSRYLSNAKYQGNSSKAWYLLADSMDLAVVEVAFLNGQEAPTIETADADFNTLGVQMRGFHDFGVAKQDSRGGVKSTGVAAA